MTSSAKLTLIYFKMRALAEPPQLLLNYANIPYEYKMSWEYFEKPWDVVKPDVPFGQLPLLVTKNGNQIAQSGSIIRYIARIANMIPSNHEIAAKADSIFETAHEMFFPLNPTINFATGSAFEEAKISILSNVQSRLENFERLLSASPEGPYFLGKELYYCDFGAFHHLSLLRYLDKNVFISYPNIQEFMGSIENINPIAEYLKKRPDLIGVGTRPQLIIDGQKCNTGVNKD